jgi:hypothetical protein
MSSIVGATWETCVRLLHVSRQLRRNQSPHSSMLRSEQMAKLPLTTVSRLQRPTYVQFHVNVYHADSTVHTCAPAGPVSVFAVCNSNRTVRSMQAPVRPADRRSSHRSGSIIVSNTSKSRPQPLHATVPPTSELAEVGTFSIPLPCHANHVLYVKT